jgi:hypothetical protein
MQLWVLIDRPVPVPVLRTRDRRGYLVRRHRGFILGSVMSKIRGVSAAALGRHLDCTSAWIGQLAKAGVLPKLPDGTFDQDACRTRYIRHLREERVRPAARADAVARAQEARARQLELRLAEEAGSLIELGALEETIGEIVATFNAELIGVPACSRDIEARGRIEEQVNGAIVRCRQRFDEAVAALASGGNPLAADETDDA